MISAGVYSSSFLADNDLAMWQPIGYSSARMMTTAGNTMLFIDNDPAGASLQPLAQYGFQLTLGQRR